MPGELEIEGREVSQQQGSAPKQQENDQESPKTDQKIGNPEPNIEVKKDPKNRTFHKKSTHNDAKGQKSSKNHLKWRLWETSKTSDGTITKEKLLTPHWMPDNETFRFKANSLNPFIFEIQNFPGETASFVLMDPVKPTVQKVANSLRILKSETHSESTYQ